jgi:hypothetical protein
VSAGACSRLRSTASMAASTISPSGDRAVRPMTTAPVGERSSGRAPGSGRLGKLRPRSGGAQCARRVVAQDVRALRAWQEPEHRQHCSRRGTLDNVPSGRRSDEKRPCGSMRHIRNSRRGRGRRSLIRDSGADSPSTEVPRPSCARRGRRARRDRCRRSRCPARARVGRRSARAVRAQSLGSRWSTAARSARPRMPSLR